MIKGVPITTNRKPTIAFQREWGKAMAALKVLTPTLQTFPLPPIEVVDERGFATPKLKQLARHFPPLPPGQLVDRLGQPTDAMLAWGALIA